MPQLDALGAALLLALLAIGDREMDEGPLTIAKVWRVWAPSIYLAEADQVGPYGRMPVPQRYAD